MIGVSLAERDGRTGSLNQPAVSTASNNVSSETPYQVVRSSDHLVTQWMCVGRSLCRAVDGRELVRAVRAPYVRTGNSST